MAFLNIYHNWQEICFPKNNITVKTITKQEIGERIKAIRLQQGYTRALVADVIGVSETTLNAYENGDRLLRLDVAYQLAQIYGTTVDKLIIFQKKCNHPNAKNDNKGESLTNYRGKEAKAFGRRQDYSAISKP